MFINVSRRVRFRVRDSLRTVVRLWTPRAALPYWRAVRVELSRSGSGLLVLPGSAPRWARLASRSRGMVRGRLVLRGALG